MNFLGRKIFFSILLFFSFFGLFYNFTFSDCTNFDKNTDISECLNTTINGSSLVGVGNNYKIEEGFKDQISKITKTLASILSLLAVGVIAFAGFKMTISIGKEDETKKAKDIIKWTLIGYLALISVGAIISIVINIVYGIG